MKTGDTCIRFVIQLIDKLFAYIRLKQFREHLQEILETFLVTAFDNTSSKDKSIFLSYILTMAEGTSVQVPGWGTHGYITSQIIDNLTYTEGSNTVYPRRFMKIYDIVFEIWRVGYWRK